MSASPQTSHPGTPSDNPGLGLPLIVIATAQLMLVLDDSVANIALPTIQNELGISSAMLPWVINAYILTFGGLLLFGGRVGDLFGRRRVFRLSVALFTVASLLVGLAPSGGLGLRHAHLVGQPRGAATAEAEDLERHLAVRGAVSTVDGEPQSRPVTPWSQDSRG